MGYKRYTGPPNWFNVNAINHIKKNLSRIFSQEVLTSLVANSERPLRQFETKMILRSYHYIKRSTLEHFAHPDYLLLPRLTIGLGEDRMILGIPGD